MVCVHVRSVIALLLTGTTARPVGSANSGFYSSVKTANNAAAINPATSDAVAEDAGDVDSTPVDEDATGAPRPLPHANNGFYNSLAMTPHIPAASDADHLNPTADGVAEDVRDATQRAPPRVEEATGAPNRPAVTSDFYSVNAAHIPLQQLGDDPSYPSRQRCGPS